jgi:hypothetical protein
MTATTTTKMSPKCILDPTVINGDSIGNLSDIGLSFFADLCGRNRGVMVLPNDPDTYGCTEFPKDYAARAGLVASDQKKKDDVIPSITDANAIPQRFANGTITAIETVQLLDYFVQNVYTSSPKVEEDPYACNAGGLAMLSDCPIDNADTTATTTTTAPSPVLPIRAATLAGLFTDTTPWATNGRRLTIHEARDFYTPVDFTDMKQIGLNTVQIPIPLDIFMGLNDGQQQDTAQSRDRDHHDHPHDRHRLDATTTTGPSPWLDLLTNVIAMAATAELQVILVLVENGPPDDVLVATAAQYAVDQQVLGLTVPRSNAVTAARSAAGPNLNLLVPVLQDDLKHLAERQYDKNVFAALDLGHTGTVADVASSTSADDRMKLFYHESLACVLRSPLEYSACYQGIPVFVSNGFDLSIDDCVKQKYTPDVFVDYGQCGRLSETIDSQWWDAHRTSFFARQQFSYERGLGWSFAAWKLYDNDDDDHHHNRVAGLTEPERLLSLKDVVAAGLVPAGGLHNDNKSNHHHYACLNPPANDFTLGDATLAPVPAPPPDCGNGWWNETIQDCSYWIPPITNPPTTSPTSPPCPEMVEQLALTCPAPPNLVLVGGLTALIGLIVGAILSRLATTRRRDGYQEISVSV